MKPFDLSKALAGEKVVDRDGLEILEIYYFKTSGEKYPVRAVHSQGDIIRTHRIDGSYYDNQFMGYDLFMATEKKKGWIVKSKNALYVIPDIFLSIEDAKQYCIKEWFDEPHIQIEIEWEESEMTREIKIICDNCKWDISNNWNGNYFLSLNIEKSINYSGSEIAIGSSLPIDRDKHFCSLTCLHSWVMESNGRR